MATLIEHKVMNYLKVIYVCGSTNEAIGDIPGGPYCFESKVTQEIDGASVKWSDWLTFKEGLKVRFSGAYVLGKLASVTFHVVGIECSEDPEKLYKEIMNFLSSECMKR